MSIPKELNKGWDTLCKDLINENGIIISDKELIDNIKSERNIYVEIMILKQYVIRKFKDKDYSIAPYIKTRNRIPVLYDNKWYDIKGINDKLI